MGGRILVMIAIVEGALLVWLLAAVSSRGTSDEPVRVVDGGPAPSADRAAEAASRGKSTDPTLERQEPASTRAPVQDVPVAAAPAVLVGCVRDSDGNAMAEAILSVHLRDAPATERFAWTSLRRDAAGRFAIPGLLPAGYRVDVRSPGFRERSIDFDVPAGVEWLRQDVALSRSWELRVWIDVPDGTPISRSLAALRKERPSLWRLAVAAVATVDPPPERFPATDLAETPFGSGRWISAEERIDRNRSGLPKGCAGRLELPEDRPMYVSAVLRDVVLATERVDARQTEVKLVVPFEAVVDSLCTVKLRVVDALTGQAAPEARVALHDAQSGGGGEPVGEDGRIELSHQRPGILHLAVRASDRITRPLAVVLQPGAIVDLGEIRIHEPVRVAFRFEGVDDEAEIQVGIRSLESTGHPALRARTSNFGGHVAGSTFEARLAPGRHRLTARGGGAIGTLEFDTASVGSVALVVPMQAAAPLRIVPPDSPIELTLSAPSGSEVYRRWITWTSPYELPLVPGAYVAVVRGLGGTSERRTVTVGATGGDLDLR